MEVKLSATDDRIDGMLSSVAVSGLDCVTKFDGSRYQTLTNTVSSIILLIKTGKMWNKMLQDIAYLPHKAAAIKPSKLQDIQKQLHFIATFWIWVVCGRIRRQTATFYNSGRTKRLGERSVPVKRENWNLGIQTAGVEPSARRNKDFPFPRSSQFTCCILSHVHSWPVSSRQFKARQQLRHDTASCPAWCGVSRCSWVSETSCSSWSYSTAVDSNVSSTQYSTNQEHNAPSENHW